MISATIVFIIMVVAVVIVFTGVIMALVSILLDYTGRSKSYDRAAVKMSKANDPKPAKTKAKKAE